MSVRELVIEIPDDKFSNYVESIESLCKKLGYELIGKESCPNDVIESSEEWSRRKIKLQRNLVTKNIFDCIHYGTETGPFYRRKKEGLIFLLESTRKEVNDFLDSSYDSEKRKIVSTDFKQNLGLVKCYGYGNNYDGEEVGISSLLPRSDCCTKMLELPSIVKEIKLIEKLPPRFTFEDFPIPKMKNL